MQVVSRFFATRWGPILAGAVIGVIAALLVRQGNPGNMGLCMGCFTRDTAGGLGLHSFAPTQYVRPEIIGLILGSMLSALLFREFRARSGSAPLVRFILGFFSSVGALVFLGCPWRAYLRFSGGDWNAMVGLVGMTVGIGIGILFLKRGFSLGRNYQAPSAGGWAMPLIALALLALLLVWGLGADGKPTGKLLFSSKGPGAMHATLLISLGAGLLIGILAQRSRFCTVGAVRDLIMLRDSHLFLGVCALVVAALGTNLALGLFKAGFEGQPIAHAVHAWNFLAMVLSGLCFTLAGGCPGRQIVLSGEGDGDAGIFFIGMLVGAAMSHNFALAAAPASAVKAGGPGMPGQVAVITGIVLCLLIGWFMREPRRKAKKAEVVK